MRGFTSSIPAGKSGKWKVEKFTITEDRGKLYNLQLLFSGQGARAVDPVNYTRLTCEGRGVIMSDTPAECSDFLYFVHRAEGSILVNGLGLGCVVQALLAKREVSDVTVIEIEQDVIDLVAPHVADPRLTVIHADAYDWKPPPGRTWDFAWHDIWDDITSDNLPLMGKLHRKYARRLRCGQESWARNIVKSMRRQEQRAGW
jgi:hypothetical protein